MRVFLLSLLAIVGIGWSAQGQKVTWVDELTVGSNLDVCGAPDTLHVVFTAAQAIAIPYVEVSLPAGVVYVGYAIGAGSKGVITPYPAANSTKPKFKLAALAAGDKVHLKVVRKAQGTTAVEGINEEAIQLYDNATSMGAEGLRKISIQLNKAQVNVTSSTGAALAFGSNWNSGEVKTQTFKVENTGLGKVNEVRVQVELPLGNVVNIVNTSLRINNTPATYANYVGVATVSGVLRYTFTFATADFGNATFNIGNKDGYLGTNESFTFSFDIGLSTCGNKAMAARALWGCPTTTVVATQTPDVSIAINAPGPEGGAPVLSNKIYNEGTWKSGTIDATYGSGTSTANLVNNYNFEGENKHFLEITHVSGGVATNIRNVSVGNTMTYSVGWIKSHKIYFKNRPNDPVPCTFTTTKYAPTGLYLNMLPHKDLQDSLIDVVYTVAEMRPGDVVVLEVIEGRRAVDCYSLQPPGTEVNYKVWTAGLRKPDSQYSDACGQNDKTMGYGYPAVLVHPGASAWTKPTPASLYPEQTVRLTASSVYTGLSSLLNIRTGKNNRVIVRATLPSWLSLDTAGGKGITALYTDGVSVPYRHMLEKNDTANVWTAEFSIWDQSKEGNKLFFDVKGATGLTEAITGNVQYNIDYYTGDIPAGNTGTPSLFKVTQQYASVTLMPANEGLNMTEFAARRTRIGYASATGIAPANVSVVNQGACIIGDTIALEYIGEARNTWANGYAWLSSDQVITGQYRHEGTWLYLDNVPIRALTVHELSSKVLYFDLTDGGAPIADGTAVRVVSRWSRLINTTIMHTFTARMFASVAPMSAANLLNPASANIKGQGEFLSTMAAKQVLFSPSHTETSRNVTAIETPMDNTHSAYVYTPTSSIIFPNESRRYLFIDTMRVRIPRGYYLRNGDNHRLSNAVGSVGTYLQYSYKTPQSNGDTIYVFGFDHLYHQDYNTVVPAGKLPPISAEVSVCGFISQIRATVLAPAGLTHFSYTATSKGVLPGVPNMGLRGSAYTNSSWQSNSAYMFNNVIPMVNLNTQTPASQIYSNTMQWSFAATNPAPASPAAPVQYVWYYLQANDTNTKITQIQPDGGTAGIVQPGGRWVQMPTALASGTTVNHTLVLDYQGNTCSNDVMYLYPVYSPQNSAAGWQPDISKPIDQQASNVLVGEPLVIYAQPLSSAVAGRITPLDTTASLINNLSSPSYQLAVNAEGKIIMGSVFPVEIRVVSTGLSALVEPTIDLIIPTGIEYRDSINMEGFVHYKGSVIPIKTTALYNALKTATGSAPTTLTLKLSDVVPALSTAGIPGSYNTQPEDREYVLNFYMRANCDISFEGAHLQATFKGRRPCGNEVPSIASASSNYLLANLRKYQLKMTKAAFVGTVNPSLFNDCDLEREVELSIKKTGSADLEQDTLVLELPKYLSVVDPVAYDLLDGANTKKTSGISPRTDSAAVGALHYLSFALPRDVINAQTNKADAYSVVYKLKIRHNPTVSTVTDALNNNIQYTVRGIVQLAGCGDKRGMLAEANTPMILEKPAAEVHKVAVRDSVATNGFAATYLYIVKNIGNVELTNILLTDSITKTFGDTAVYKQAKINVLNSTWKLNSSYNGGTDVQLSVATANNKLQAGASDTIAVNITGLLPTTLWLGGAYQSTARLEASTVSNIALCKLQVTSDKASLPASAIRWSVDTVRHPEVDANLPLKVQRIGDLSGTVSYYWRYHTDLINAPKHKATLASSWQPGVDVFYDPLSGTSILQARQTDQSHNLGVWNDDEYEPQGEWFNAVLTKIEGSVLAVRPVSLKADSACYIHITEANTPPVAYLRPTNNSRVNEGNTMQWQVALSGKTSVEAQLSLSPVGGGTAVLDTHYSGTFPLTVTIPAGDTLANIDIVTLHDGVKDCPRSLPLRLKSKTGVAPVDANLSANVGTVVVADGYTDGTGLIYDIDQQLTLHDDVFTLAIGENNTLHFAPLANDTIPASTCCPATYMLRDGTATTGNTLSGAGKVTLHPDHTMSYQTLNNHFSGLDSIYYVAEALCPAGRTLHDTALVVFRVTSPDVTFADNTLRLDFTSQPGQVEVQTKVYNSGDTTLQGNLAATLYVGGTPYTNSLPGVSLAKGDTALLSYNFAVPNTAVDGTWVLTINDNAGVQPLLEANTANNSLSFGYHATVGAMYACQGASQASIFTNSTPSALSFLGANTSITTAQGQLVNVDTLGLQFAFDHLSGNDSFAFTYQYGTAPRVHVLQQVQIVDQEFGVRIAAPASHACPDVEYTLSATIDHAPAGLQLLWKPVGTAPAIVDAADGTTAKVQIPFNGYDRAAYTLQATLGTVTNSCVASDTVVLAPLRADSLHWLYGPAGQTVQIYPNTSTNSGAGYRFAAQANVIGASYHWYRTNDSANTVVPDSVLSIPIMSASLAGTYVVMCTTPCVVITDTLVLSYFPTPVVSISRTAISDVNEGQDMTFRVSLGGVTDVPVEFDLEVLSSSTAVAPTNYNNAFSKLVSIAAGDTVAIVTIQTVHDGIKDCSKQIDIKLKPKSGASFVDENFSGSTGTLAVAAGKSDVSGTIYDIDQQLTLHDDVFTLAIGENNTLHFAPLANDTIPASTCCPTTYMLRDGTATTGNTLSGAGKVTLHPDHTISYQTLNNHFSGLDSIYYVAEALCPAGRTLHDTALVVFRVTSPDVTFADNTLRLDFTNLPGQVQVQTKVYNSGDTTLQGNLAATLYVGGTPYTNSLPGVSLAKGDTALLSYNFAVPNTAVDGTWVLTINDNAGVQPLLEANTANNSLSFGYHATVGAMYACQGASQASIFTNSTPSALSFLGANTSITTVQGQLVNVDTLGLQFAFDHLSGNDSFAFTYQYGTAPRVHVLQQVQIVDQEFGVRIAAPASHACPNIEYTLTSRVDNPGGLSLSMLWKPVGTAPAIVGATNGTTARVLIDFAGYDRATYSLQASLGTATNYCMVADTVHLAPLRADSLHWLYGPGGTTTYSFADNANNGGAGFRFAAQANVIGATYRWYRAGHPESTEVSDSVLSFTDVRNEQAGTYVVECSTPCAVVRDTLVLTYIKATAQLESLAVNGAPQALSAHIEAWITCDYAKDSIEVSYVLSAGATTHHAPSPYYLPLGKPGQPVLDTIVVETPGAQSTTYYLRIIAPLGKKSNLIVEKKNVVLIANNNPKTNGGYRFRSYQWYFVDANQSVHDIGAGQNYYSSLTGLIELDTVGYYYARLVTEEGDTLYTCPTNYASKALRGSVYPNPLPLGSLLNVDLQEVQPDATLPTSVLVYTSQGLLIREERQYGLRFQINMPSLPGSYFVKVTHGNLMEVFTVQVY